MENNKLEQAAIDCFGKSGSMCSARMGFREGALWQKERDELAWGDIADIDTLLTEVTNCIATGNLPEMKRKEFYTEVLKRFKEHKEKEKE